MFEIERNAGATTLRVRSEVDFAVSDTFFGALNLACEDSSQLIVSLEDCPYIDCAGLSALVRIRNVAPIPMSTIVRNESFLYDLFAIAGLQESLGVIGWSSADLAA